MTSDAGERRDGTGGGSAPAPDLVVREGELRPIGDDAARLARVAETAGRPALEMGAVVNALNDAGLGSGDALSHASVRFAEQGSTLSRECRHIAGELGSTVSTLGAVEAERVTDLLGATQWLRPGNPAIDIL
ncbi:hypothetical protein [Streptomyces sp. URMC 129]|uniref:hypothetical protein n=1 Tax=Streptomyces sp. URMC 129 TaxID=3423407 RepID=UPI003F1D1982